MRGGYFLAEESPERLIQQFNAESLEDVFLKLSVIQNMGKRRRSSIVQSVTHTIQVPELPGGVVNDAAVLDDEPGEISGEFGDNTSMSSRAGSEYKTFDFFYGNIITATKHFQRKVYLFYNFIYHTYILNNVHGLSIRHVNLN